MNTSNDNVKGRATASSEGKKVVADDDLDPCDKPQAQEASSLVAADEACDDGVN